MLSIMNIAKILHPLGPNSVVSIIFSKFISLDISIAHSYVIELRNLLWEIKMKRYGKWSFAGSKLTTATFLSNLKFQRIMEYYLPVALINSCIPPQYVVFPEPGGPNTTCPKGIAV